MAVIGGVNQALKLLGPHIIAYGPAKDPLGRLVEREALALLGAILLDQPNALLDRKAAG